MKNSSRTVTVDKVEGDARKEEMEVTVVSVEGRRYENSSTVAEDEKWYVKDQNWE